MNKKIIILTSALLFSLSSLASGDYVLKFNNSQSKGMIPEVNDSPSTAFSSCKDILDNGESTGNGVYSITVDNNQFNVYCDMTSAGGGWTMVVAQFEKDPVTNWNEGAQSDYDPSLSTGKGFALNSQEIPSHTQTAFGKDFDADNIDAVNFSYVTAPIVKTTVTSIISGVEYHIARNEFSHYPYHDPDGSESVDSRWYETLTFDEKNKRGLNWAFGPNFTTASTRGYSYGGSSYTSSIQDFAWTVWVR